MTPAKSAAALLLLALAVGAGANGHVLELLPSGSAAGWEERSFVGNTRYRTETVGGVASLRAEADGTASGLYRNRAVSLARWPVLRWRWRVDALPRPGDERAKSGDDFAARVYVIATHPVFFWKTRAVCYVWADAVPVGDSWPNPYTGNVVMVALRSGAQAAGGWVEERRDIAADFRRHFGEAPGSIDAVAIMTDTDQSGARAAAWYEGLRFEAP